MPVPLVTRYIRSVKKLLATKLSKGPSLPSAGPEADESSDEEEVGLAKHRSRRERRHADHSDLATGILGGSAMKRLALLCTGEKNKYGRDHQYQRTDDQQQYFCSAPPFGGLR